MLHGGASPEPPTEEYLRFVEEARPDVLIAGVFDQRLFGLAAPGAKRAAVDPGELLAKWKGVAERLHRKGIRLVGQMELFVVSDRPQDLDVGVGWFGFYDKHWNEKLLGRRPTKSVRDLLAHSDVPEGLKSDSVARCGCRVNAKAILGCVNNPHWLETHKRMIAAAVDVGVDGFVTNRNFFEHCDCSHCQDRFRGWLDERFTPDGLRPLGIANVKTHRLCVTGVHRVHDVAPDALGLEKIRFVKRRVREFFEDAYLTHGRSLKKDLFAAQWNHAAYFDELHLDRGHLPTSTRTSLAHALADERWGASADDWGRGESLIWYCNWGTTQNTILAKEYAGDTTLYGLYLRAMARGKPYVVNKYDYYRPRVTMAEAAALGYATNAISTTWQHADDRALVLRYFRFLRTHEELYRDARRHAEIGLLFPRRAIAAGDASALEYVEACGRTLIREHLLFDVIPDDLLTQTPLAGFRTLIVAAPEWLQPGEREALRKFSESGGKLIWTLVDAADRDRPGAAVKDVKRPQADLPPATLRIENARVDRDGFRTALVKQGDWSNASAPWTVEIHTYRQEAKNRWIVHLVNYNHVENAPGKSVSAREAPIAADPTPVRLRLPAGTKIQSVRFLSPDDDDAKDVPFRLDANTLAFTAPAFLAYGVCVVEAK